MSRAPANGGAVGYRHAAGAAVATPDVAAPADAWVRLRVALVLAGADPTGSADRARFRSLPRPRAGLVGSGAAAAAAAAAGPALAVLPGGAVAVAGDTVDTRRPTAVAPVGPPSGVPGAPVAPSVVPAAPAVPAPTAPGDAEQAPDEEQRAVLDLVERAQQGDSEAFGRLYDRYVDLVYRYVYYRVGTAALAEDLTSETFLRALRRIGSFTWQGRDVGAWLVTIARNLVADHYKSGRYRLEVSTADMLGAGADRAEDGPEGVVLESITNAQLLGAVKQLNPEQQECIVLRFLQGLSVAETALAMGKNEGAIKALQYRAVRALGRLLPVDVVA